MSVVESKVTSVKKFYFLEYFYILLKSVQTFSEVESIFSLFLFHKDQFQLGESKYRKINLPDEEPTSKKLMRYQYTFNEVVEEAEMYGLLKKSGNNYYLTSEGDDLIYKYETSPQSFNDRIFQLMEGKLNGFYYLVKKCYESNRNSGLLIFPMYSPAKLDISKASIKKTKDIIHYINALTDKLSKDITDHLNVKRDLTEKKELLIQKLRSAELLKEDPEELFDNNHYNVILKRIRDYWLNFFLNDVYSIQMSLSYFDIWCYRGKQLGIVNATEFYHNFDGKVIYPVSLLATEVSNKDFIAFFSYADGKSLYIHAPTFDSIQDIFTKSVHESYIDIKRKVKTNFINLADLRDIVCFKLRISYEKFAEYLEALYQLNLKNEVKISISLEADKLPSETKAMYLKREPIIIDNKSRNIISVDIKRLQ